MQSTSSFPVTKNQTISVEGESRQITLSLFNNANLPFITYIPANNFTIDILRAGAESYVRFYLKHPDGTPNADAFVHIFFPEAGTTIDQLRQRVQADQGILALNQWKITHHSEDSLYPWVKEHFRFEKRSSDRFLIGSLFLGQVGGRTFWVAEQYPAEYGDGFEPLASWIFTNFQVKGNYSG